MAGSTFNQAGKQMYKQNLFHAILPLTYIIFSFLIMVCIFGFCVHTNKLICGEDK